jgi:DNA-binding NarL/FixJ family response regulator
MNDVQHSILIVDDDPLVRNAVQRLLNSAGFKSNTAPDGFEALNLLHHSMPDLMLLDLEMPGISGLELLHLLSKDGIQPRTVILTAKPSIHSALEAGQLSVVDYFIKPLNIDMVTRIREILEDEAVSSSITVTKRIAEILNERGLSERVHPTVINLYSGGGTNRKISENLGISWSTVRSHLSQAMVAFEVNSRSELVSAIVQEFSRSK